MHMKKYILILLLVGCGSVDRSGTVIDAVTGAIVSAPPVEEGDKFFAVLPWLVSVCALLVFVFGWYTPSPRDNVPCTVASGVLMAFAMAVARHGKQISDVVTWSCYVAFGITALICLIFFIKGLVQSLTKRRESQNTLQSAPKELN